MNRDDFMAGFVVGVFSALLFVALVERASTSPVEHGLQGPVAPGPPYKRVHVVTTGYHCPPCDVGMEDDGLTASNKPVRPGICAADTRFYDFGTRFFVPGYGPCVVEDRGAKVRGRHLDLYFPSREQAKQWGRQIKEVWLLLDGQSTKATHHPGH